MKTLSVDGGSTWYRISGEKGSSGSAGEDNQGITVTLGTDYVTFTLEDGQSFKVPYYGEGSAETSTGFYLLSAGEYDGTETYDGNKTVAITVKYTSLYSYYFYFHYPNNVQKEDITNIIAEIVTSSTDEDTGNNENFITTRATDPQIGVFIDKDDDLTEGYCMRVKAKGMSSGETFIIRATLTTNDGTSFVTTRAVSFNGPMKVGDILYSDGSYSTNLISGKTPIGIIFSLDPDRIGEAEKEALAAKGVTNPTGLVMALSDATVPGNINYHNSGTNPSSEDQIQSDYNLL